MPTRRQLLGTAAALCAGRALAGPAPPPAAPFSVERKDGCLTLRDPAGQPVLRYVAEGLPEGEAGPAVEGFCFVHPVRTPGGVVLTDQAPADHPHHRGVFCAWVEVSGAELGDWWGWGARAPKEGRAIISREARATDEGPKGATLRLINSWRAGSATVLRERLTLAAQRAPDCHVLDFEYKFTTGGREAVVLAPSAFSGFCFRGKALGRLEATGADGAVELPDSRHDRPDTNWPAQGWYDFSYVAADGRAAGAAVMSHPSNPETTWHGVRSIHMLNPCIVAGGAVTIPFGEPLYLRYRLVAHDGRAADVDLPALYDAFAGTE